MPNQEVRLELRLGDGPRLVASCPTTLGDVQVKDKVRVLVGSGDTTLPADLLVDAVDCERIAAFFTAASAVLRTGKNERREP